MPKEYIPYLVMAAAMVLMIRRTMMTRRIRAGGLWVLPVILLAIMVLALAQTPPKDAAGIGAVVVAAALGGVAGWYRGKFTHISLDAETGVLTGKGSAIGLVLILGLYVARYAVITWARTHPDKGGVAMIVADCALVFGFATLIVSRLEMWLRCRKLMAQRPAAA